MGFKDFFRKFRSTGVRVDYSRWEDDALVAQWRARGQLTAEARGLLQAELDRRGLATPGAAAGTPREPGDEDVMAEIAAAEAAEDAEDAEDGEPDIDPDQLPKLNLLHVVNGWSVALWAGNDEFCLIVFPPREDEPDKALAPPQLSGDERVTSIVVLDPLDRGWMPARGDVERLGVEERRVWRLGAGKAPALADHEHPGHALPKVLDLGQLRLDRVDRRRLGLRARWTRMAGAVLLGPDVTPEMIAARPHPALLVGGTEPVTDETQSDWAKGVDPVAFDALGEALLMGGARDVAPEQAKLFLPQMGVSVTLIGRPAQFGEGGSGDVGTGPEVQQAAVAGDWERVRELAPALTKSDLEELFEANVIAERFDLVERVGTIVCELDPEHGLGWFLRGAVATMQGDDEGALAHYGRAVEVGRPEARAWANLAAVQAERGELDAALATVEEGLAKLPGDEVIRTTHVFVLRNRGDEVGARAALARHADALSDRTRESLQRLLDLPYEAPTGPPRRRWPHLAARAALAASELVREGALDAAEHTLRRAWALDNSQEALLKAALDVGPALVDAEQLDRAMALYELFLAEYPNMAPIRFNRGNVLLQLDRAEEALAEYTRCIEILPQWGDPRVNQVATLTLLGRFDEAEKALDVLEQAGVDMDLVMALDNDLETAKEKAGIVD